MEQPVETSGARTTWMMADGTPGTRERTGTLTDFHNLDGLDELAF